MKSSLGATLGSLSLAPADSSFDYDITRYTLLLNSANELCLSVESNIPVTSDYVLLYNQDHQLSWWYALRLKGDGTGGPTRALNGLPVAFPSRAAA